MNNHLEKLKKINKDEDIILDKKINLKLDILLISKDNELEKTIQQKNQFERMKLLNTNILDLLFV